MTRLSIVPVALLAALAALAAPRPSPANPAQASAPPPDSTPFDPAAVFRLHDEPPVRVVFSISPDSSQGPALDTPMGRTLAGVLDARSGAGVWPALRALVESDTRPREATPIDTRLCIAWLFDRNGQSKRVEIGRTPEGWLLARELDSGDDGLDLARLDERRFHLLSADWPALRTAFDAPRPFLPGQLAEVNKPYLPGRIVLDSPTLRQRVYGRAPTKLAPLDRDLAQETFYARAPKGPDTLRPAGLLVWIAAVDSPQPPLDVLAPACDELGVVLVSIADAGNAREIADRLQLVFDAVETVSARTPIDPKRVYLSGISGGGRCSSILWGCFPDLFTGAVPIVGLDSYQPAPTGTGRAWPSSFLRPTGSMLTTLRSRRLAAITGENDFNYPEITVRIDGLRRDGLDVRLIAQPGMGHEMPTPETFAQALRWVDEPARTAAVTASAEASTLLARARTQAADRRTRMLERVMQTAPWSEPAWEAYRLLTDP